MKKIWLLSILGCSLNIALSFATPTYRLGTFNIRIISNADTGNKAWNIRKTYVAKIVKDYAYDAIGFQEISNQTQEDDLRTLLSDEYTLVTWGRDSATQLEGERVGIGYKTQTFTLLDSGYYFVNSDITKPGASWDAKFSRLTVYVKLQNKASGEIFYYFSTHLDNVGSTARCEETRINVQQMQKIAGMHPCFLVGDFNTSVENSVHYTIAAYYDDARSYCTSAPIGPIGTYSNWSPTGSSSGKRLDYIYSNRANILTYETITEDYGCEVTPSDHYPLIITCQLKGYNAKSRIHVSTSGSDEGDGSVTAPFRSISKAVSIANSQDTICLTQGTFFAGDPATMTRTTSITLARSVTFLGGYNNNFSSIEGKTTISGDYLQNDVYNEDGTIASGNDDNSQLLFNIPAPYRIIFENIILQGAYCDGNSTSTGAAILALGSGVEMFNSALLNNYTSGLGAAVYTTGNLVMNKCEVAYNKATNGAGLAIIGSTWDTNICNSYFHNNYATSGASAYITGTTAGYISGNTFYNNTSTQYGNFTLFNTESTASFLFVNNTFANNMITTTSGLFNKLMGGGAVYIYQSTAGICNWVNNTIVGNKATCRKNDGSVGTNFFGAAIHVRGGRVSFYNSIIAANSSDSNQGGDIYLENAFQNRSAYNVYTSTDNLNNTPSVNDILATDYLTGVNQLALMLAGTIKDSYFIPTLTNNGGDTPTIKMLSSTYGTYNINILTPTLLNESMLSLDLNGDGIIAGPLFTDQCGFLRNLSGNSSIGACEYKEGSGIMKDVLPSSVAYYYNKMLHINTNKIKISYYITNINGQIVKQGTTDDQQIDVSDLSDGIYIAKIDGVNLSTTLKFIR